MTDFYQRIVAAQPTIWGRDHCRHWWNNPAMQFLISRPLGNDYLVIDPRDWLTQFHRAADQFAHLSSWRWLGGILWGPLPARDGAPFAHRAIRMAAKHRKREWIAPHLAHWFDH